MVKSFFEWEKQFRKRERETRCNTDNNSNLYFFNTKEAKELIKNWRQECNSLQAESESETLPVLNCIFKKNILKFGVKKIE